MCGIAGIYAFGPHAPAPDRRELRAIRDHMAARGPDGEGEWFSTRGDVALAHRRLSIIELSGRGAQPMCSPDGKLVITFNGEIYNYRELRKALIAGGRTFISDSDTEVLLHLYAQHGQDMLRHLRGMFAFAIWDADRQALFMARDTFGIKPLYYSQAGGTLRFASQVKALLAGGQIATAPAAAGHAGYFLWGSVPAPWTLYRDIRSLPAGHFMWVSQKGAGEPQPHCRVEDILAAAAAEPAQGSVDDALDAICEAVRDSVAAHHVADVPIGLFLSAGLDSAMIASLALHAGHRPKTMTLAFSEYAGSTADEAPLAERLAAQLGTDHSTVTVRQADFEAQSAAFRAAMDQPSTDGINSWFISRAAKSQGIKVALSGLGGDELFGSYPSFTDIPRMRALARPFARWPGLCRSVRKAFAPLLSRVSSPKYASLLEYGGTTGGAYLLRRALYLPWELPAVMDAELARQGLRDLDVHERLGRSTAGIRSDRLAISALEMACYTQHQLLADTDWASMAHSMEIRVPFLDVPLLRAAAPWLAAFPQLRKRDIARHLAPELSTTFLNKPKTGFTVPVRQWLGITHAEESARGLRGWAKVIYGQQAEPAALHTAPLPTVALWSPEMAAPGGIQNYMWRLWEMLAAARGAAQPPAGLSLMDQPEALRRWIHPVATRPRSASASKLKFTRWALGAPGKAHSVVVGHVHHAPVAWAAQLVGNIDRYFVVLHGIEAWQRLTWLQRLALRKAQAVIATTHYTARRCSTINQLPAGKFTVIPLCADPAPAAPDPAFRLTGAFPILFVGRLATSERYKGLETLMDATGRLLDHGIDVTLHVVGEGNDRPRLEELVRARGLQHFILFHGRVNDAQLQAAYASAKVFAMPSAKEGFGIVFLEAMRHGVACVGGDHGGTPEVFAKDREGFLVTYGDVDALAACLQAMATDAAMCERLGDAGKRRFESEYSHTAFASRWQKLLSIE